MRKLIAWGIPALFLASLGAWQAITLVNTNTRFLGYLDASSATASSPFPVLATPSGSCATTPTNQWGMDSSGNLYWCNAGTWTLFNTQGQPVTPGGSTGQYQVNGGSGSFIASTLNGIAYFTNGIAAAATWTNVNTLFTASPAASFCAPLIGGRWKIDCLIPTFAGGSYAGTWSSGTAYVAGNGVTYSGSYYLATGASTNVTPTSAAAYPWALTNHTGTSSPPPTDQSAYYVIAQAYLHSKLLQLDLGTGTDGLGEGYQTCLGWNMGNSSSYGVSFIGTPQYTGLSAQCSMTSMISHPTGTGLLGRLDIENIVFQATGSGGAAHCWTLNSLTGATKRNLSCNRAQGYDYWAMDGDPANAGGADYADESDNVVVAGPSIQQAGFAVWTAPTGGNGAWTLVTPAAATYQNANPPAMIWPTGYLRCTVVGTYTVTMTAGKPAAVTTSGYTCPAVTLYAVVPDIPQVTYGWEINEIDGRYHDLQCYSLGTAACLYDGGGDLVGDLHVGLSPVCYYEQGIVNNLNIYFDNCYHGMDLEQSNNEFHLSADWSQWKDPGPVDVYFGPDLYSTSAMSVIASKVCGQNLPTGGGYTQFAGPNGAIADSGTGQPFPSIVEISAAQNCITNAVVNRHNNLSISSAPAYSFLGNNTNAVGATGFFQLASSYLSDAANLAYLGSANVFTANQEIQDTTNASGDVLFGAVSHSGAEYPGLWFGGSQVSAPSVSNFAMLGDPTGNTYINAQSGASVYLRVNNTTVETISSSLANFAQEVATAASLKSGTGSAAGCLELYDAAGTLWYYKPTTGTGVLTPTSTKPSGCN